MKHHNPPPHQEITMYHSDLTSAVAQTRLDDLDRDLRRRALTRRTSENPAPAQRRRALRPSMARMQRAASPG